MTQKIGRNEPCRCGSGKKYKKCCLLKEREADQLESARSEGLRTVTDWLAEHYEEEAFGELAERYFGLFDRGLVNDVGELPPSVLQTVWSNAWEWLVADGQLVVDGESRSPLSLIYDLEGPTLTSEQHRWLERLAQRRLGLYEVVRIEPGVGAWLEDRMDRERGSFRVVGAAAQRLRPKASLGLRLVPSGGDWEMSSAVYALEPWQAEEAEDVIAEALERIEDPAAKPHAAGEAIISAWLGFLVEAHLLDEPENHVYDHYRVADWEGLEEALARQDDVEGDRTHGWTRFETDDEGERFVIEALNPLPDGRLLVFFQMEEMAREEAEWLERLAPGAVVLESRRVFDPGLVDEPSPELGEPPEEGTPKEKGAWMRRYLEEAYKDWKHKPIVLFGGKSPALMVRSEEGKTRVAELIRSYQAREKEEAADDGREEVSFEFLWKSVGLDPVESRDVP